MLAPCPKDLRRRSAMAALDRQLIFQHQTLHPEYSPALDRVLELIPPRNSTLIRAASEYSRSDIPWTKVDELHELCAEGFPRGQNFYVTTSPSCKTTAEPYQLDAYFALKPSIDTTPRASSTTSVIG